jgi:hypothetical protein
MASRNCKKYTKPPTRSDPVKIGLFARSKSDAQPLGGKKTLWRGARRLARSARAGTLVTDRGGLTWVGGVRLVE